MVHRGVIGGALALLLVLAPASAAFADDTAPDPAAPATSSVVSGASGLAWKSTGRSTAQLSWDAASGVAGTPDYTVLISTTTPYSAPRTTTTSATTLEVDGLPPGSHTTAVVTVQGLSTTSSVWTQPAVAPSAPASVRSTSAGTAAAPSVSVSWNAPASSGGATVVSYSVQVSAVEAPTTVVASAHVAAPSRSAVISGLQADTAYFASVRAVNAAGTSAARQSSPVFTLGATASASPRATTQQPQQQAVAAPVVTPRASAGSRSASPAPATQRSTTTVANTVPTVAALPLPVAIAVAVMSLLFGACVVGLIAIRRRPWYR